MADDQGPQKWSVAVQRGERGEGDATVTVTGDLDVAAAPTLREALHDVAQLGHTTVSLDLRQVSFADSTGLSAVLGGHKAIVETLGGRFTVLVRPGPVLRLFELAGLDRTIQLDVAN